MCVNIRPFGSGDTQAVREVHLKAFANSEDEARLVESLHTAGAAPVSLVAVEDEASKGVVGHVLFSPVEVDNGVPGARHRLALIRAGLEACREAAYDAVVVLGEPGYYFRFGFERASGHGLGNEYGVDDYFMVAELRSEVLDGVGGTVRYRPEFDQVEP